MHHFDHIHYVPVLRWKRAESRALAELFHYETEVERMTPLIEVVPPSLRPTKRGRATVDDALSKIAHDILDNWGQALPFFLDLWHLPPALRTTAGYHPLAALADQARLYPLQLIPVTGLDPRRDADYQSAVASIVKTDHLGAGVRLQLDDLQRPSLAADLATLLRTLALEPEQTHLLVDCQVVGHPLPSLARLLARVPYLHRWRTLTFLAGSFPQYLTNVPMGTQRLPRLEWTNWRQQVVASPPLPRLPAYGDYTIQYAKYIEPPAGSNPTASIRYTSAEHWVIMRGLSARDHGYEQFPASALLLTELGEYCGERFSYGDQYIKERSLELGGPDGIRHPGSIETWLRAGINHHLVFVLLQLASLAGSPTACEP